MPCWVGSPDTEQVTQKVNIEKGYFYWLTKTVSRPKSMFIASMYMNRSEWQKVKNNSLTRIRSGKLVLAQPRFYYEQKENCIVVVVLIYPDQSLHFQRAIQATKQPLAPRISLNNHSRNNLRFN